MRPAGLLGANSPVERDVEQFAVPQGGVTTLDSRSDSNQCRRRTDSLRTPAKVLGDVVVPTAHLQEALVDAVQQRVPLGKYRGHFRPRSSGSEPGASSASRVSRAGCSAPPRPRSASSAPYLFLINF